MAECPSRHRPRSRCRARTSGENQTSSRGNRTVLEAGADRLPAASDPRPRFSAIQAADGGSRRLDRERRLVAEANKERSRAARAAGRRILRGKTAGVAEKAFEKKPHTQGGRREETPSRAPCQQAAQLCHRGRREARPDQRTAGARGDTETAAQGP